MIFSLLYFEKYCNLQYPNISFQLDRLLAAMLLRLRELLDVHRRLGAGRRLYKVKEMWSVNFKKFKRRNTIILAGSSSREPRHEHTHLGRTPTRTLHSSRQCPTSNSTFCRTEHAASEFLAQSIEDGNTNHQYVSQLTAQKLLALKGWQPRYRDFAKMSRLFRLSSISRSRRAKPIISLQRISCTQL